VGYKYILGGSDSHGNIDAAAKIYKAEIINVKLLDDETVGYPMV